MTDQFDDPSDSTGIDLKTLTGRLLLILPERVEIGIQTVLGPRDATVADVHILDGPEPGSIHRDVFLWPKVLQSQVRSNVGTGRYKLGRLGTGTAKPGQNPPWKLDAATDTEKTTARRYLEKLTIPAVDNADDDDEPPF
jgi:hypothetical protein